MGNMNSKDIIVAYLNGDTTIKTKEYYSASLSHRLENALGDNKEATGINFPVHIHRALVEEIIENGPTEENMEQLYCCMFDGLIDAKAVKPSLRTSSFSPEFSIYNSTMASFMEVV
jgi:hypothetical protein